MEISTAPKECLPIKFVIRNTDWDTLDGVTLVFTEGRRVTSNGDMELYDVVTDHERLIELH